MGVWARETRRLDLRPRMCPPLNTSDIQDPGYAGIKVLFLGLFDVTPRAGEMAAGSTGPYISKTGPKLSKTGP